MALTTAELPVYLKILGSMDHMPKRVATFGTLTLQVDLPDIYANLMEGGIAIQAVENLESYRKGRFHDGSLLFQLLGIKESVALDIISDGRSETIIQDLNKPVDPSLHGSFELVVDGHTGHHVAERLTCLQNAANILAKGGRVIHAFSMNPLVGNFLAFNPALLTQFYTAAGFDDLRFFQCAPFHDNTCFEFLGNPAKAFFIENPQRYLYVFSARKANTCSLDAAPIERIYTDHMEHANSAFDVRCAQGMTVAVWGTGGYYMDRVRPLLEDLGHRHLLWGFVDSDPAKVGTTFQGREVHGPIALRKAPVDGVILASSAKAEILPELCALLAHQPTVLTNSLALNRAAFNALHCSRLSRQLKDSLNIVKARKP